MATSDNQTSPEKIEDVSIPDDYERVPHEDVLYTDEVDVVAGFTVAEFEDGRTTKDKVMTLIFHGFKESGLDGEGGGEHTKVVIALSPAAERSLTVGLAGYMLEDMGFDQAVEGGEEDGR